MSMSRKGNCWDNAVAESPFATLEDELIEDADWHTRNETRGAFFEPLEVRYNRQRRHSSLGVPDAGGARQAAWGGETRLASPSGLIPLTPCPCRRGSAKAAPSIPRGWPPSDWCAPHAVLE